MSTTTKLVTVIFTALLSLSAFAETLHCDSPDVKIVGQIQTKYLTMGHSQFRGNLNISIYDHSQPVVVSQVTVFSGDIQDGISISTSMAKDQQGQDVTLNLEASGNSELKVGNRLTQFTPRCEINILN